MTRLKQTAASIAANVLLAGPAFAQAAGSVDVTTMTTNAERLGVMLAGGAIAAISAFKGVQAASHGQHIGPAIAGLAAGLTIAVGGAYIVSRITGVMPV